MPEVCLRADFSFALGRLARIATPGGIGRLRQFHKRGRGTERTQEKNAK
jgi:hypothetical protein